MNFNLEKEMLHPVKSWLSKRQDLIKEEFKLPWGYCDLVGCSLDNENVRERLELGQKRSIGTQSRVQLLWEIPDENTNDSISKEELYRLYSGIRSTEDLEEDLKDLAKRNFIVEDSNGRYQKLNGWFPIHNELVAVELKLKNVNEAIQQARLHLSYADASYVALPRSLAENVSKGAKKQIFSATGLGLLGVSPNWCQTILYPSARKSKNQVLQAYCAERFWREYSKNN